MNSDVNSKYAALVIAMLNVQKGQRVVLRGEPLFWDFYAVLAEEAYKKGASHVDVWPISQRLQRVKVDHAKKEFLSYTPSDFAHKHKQAMADDAAFIRVHSTAEDQAFLNVDQQRYAIFDEARMKLGRPFLSALMADLFQWIVVSYPSDVWAKQVLGSTATKHDLWDCLEALLLGDGADAVSWWQESNKKVESRARVLNRMRIKSLRLQDAHTDIHFGFSEKAKWAGGNSVSQKGIPFMSNLPSVEVFTAPDWRETHGTVRLTRPVEINDILIEGGQLVFEKGKLVEFHADKGEEALRTFFNDEKNTRIGEFALVDKSSPIAQAKHLFYNGLIDENAAIHMALGRAYITSIDGAESMNEQSLVDIGFNDALHHEDVMIGSETSQVEVTCYDGSTRTIMRDGSFVI